MSRKSRPVTTRRSLVGWQPGLEILEERTVLAANTIGAVFTVPISDPGFYASSVDVGMAPDGDVVATWFDTPIAGGDGRVRARIIDSVAPNTVRIDVANTGSSIVGSNPQVAVGADGRFTVAWAGVDAVDGPSAYMRRFNAAGTPLGSSIRLGDFGGDPGTSYRISIDMNPSGESIVAWIGSTGNAQFVKINSLGAITATGTLGSTSFVDAAIDDAGNFVAVWIQPENLQSTPSDFGKVVGKRFNTLAQPLDAAPVIYSTSTIALGAVSHGPVAVEMDARGGYKILTTAGSNFIGSGARTFTVDPNGQVVSRTTGIFGFIAGLNPSLALQSDGDSIQITQGFAPISSAFVFSYDFTGAPLDIPVTSVFDTAIATNDSGRMVVVNGIQAQIFQDAHTASAGGPYTITELGSVTLDASATVLNAPAGTTTYQWDFDEDGQFDDAVGVNPTLTWSQLEALGVTDGPAATRVVRVFATRGGASAIDSAILTVTNAPPVITPGAELRTGVRGQIGLYIYISDATADYGANYFYEVDWDNNGTFDESVTRAVNQLGPAFTHTFSTLGTKTVRVRATDKDGGVSSIVPYTFEVTPYAFYPGISSDTWRWNGSSGDDEMAWTVVDNTTLRITESKINGLVVNNIYTFSTAALDSRPTYISAYGKEGNDRIDLSALAAPIIGTLIYGDSGNDTLLGSAVVDSIFGELGNDTIHGGYGADYINGGDNNDLIFGEMPATPTLTPALASMGNDTIYGGLGNDTIYGDSDGGEGKADTIYGDDGTGAVITGGNDIIYGDGTVGHHLAADTIYGEGGNDKIYGDASGAEGASDLLNGGEGNDLIDTGGGNDIAYGESGNDILLGGDGGEGAADTLDGGLGRDIIVGDGGVLNPKQKTAGADTIGISPEIGLDSIDLVITGLVLPTEANPIDWFLIQNEWLSSATTAQKRDHLTGVTSGGLNGSSLLLPGVNVFDERTSLANQAIIDYAYVTANPSPNNSLVFAGETDVLYPTIHPPLLVNLTPYLGPA
ncbi:hypothetical protein K2X85_20450 [bacterium]|nr:hypothetical protein [bacterium]